MRFWTAGLIAVWTILSGPMFAPVPAGRARLARPSAAVVRELPPPSPVLPR
jgi:hypothetical protein